MTTRDAEIQKLRQELGPQLVSSERVQPPPGVSSGWPQLDHFLLWNGFPKGAVSLLVGPAGGATTLWLKSAAHVTRQGQWVAWINEPQTRLTPWSLRHRGADLSKVLYIDSPQNERQRLWVLQEVLSLGLVELIGCDLGTESLREPQILKLKRLALRYATALVLISHRPQPRLSSFYSLVLAFHGEQVAVHRALHRPTPHIFERRDLYADTLPQLAGGFRSLAI